MADKSTNKYTVSGYTVNKYAIGRYTIKYKYIDTKKALN